MKRSHCIAGMIVGGLLAASPLLGLLGTVFGMTRAFHTLGETGISDPHALSNDIGVTMWSTMVGILLLPIGLVGFTVSLIFYLRARDPVPPPLPPDRPAPPANDV
jgi:flagellar motor component MotA